MNNNAPLVWQFAEKICSRSDAENTCPINYDASKGLNTIEVDGVEIPFVSIKDNLVGTTTFTEASGEGNDQDLDDIMMFFGTSTVTRAERESTDED